MIRLKRIHKNYLLLSLTRETSSSSIRCNAFKENIKTSQAYRPIFESICTLVDRNMQQELCNSQESNSFKAKNYNATHFKAS